MLWKEDVCGSGNIRGSSSGSEEKMIIFLFFGSVVESAPKNASGSAFGSVVKSASGSVYLSVPRVP